MKETARIVFRTGLLAAGILLLCSVEAMAQCPYKIWRPAPSINLVIDLPEDNSVVCPEAEVACSATASDEDEWRYSDGSIWYRAGDIIASYTWTAAGGTFPYGNIESSVTWKSPTTPGTYTITCEADDLPGCRVS